MFSATLKDVNVLKKIIDSIASLVSEVNLEATPNGLTLQAMDSAHVSLVSLKMNESGFEEYRCDQNVTMGVNLNDLSKVLKMVKSDDKLILSHQNNGESLIITYENTSKLFNLYNI